MPKINFKKWFFIEFNYIIILFLNKYFAIYLQTTANSNYFLVEIGQKYRSLCSSSGHVKFYIEQDCMLIELLRTSELVIHNADNGSVLKSLRILKLTCKSILQIDSIAFALCNFSK